MRDNFKDAARQWQGRNIATVPGPGGLGWGGWGGLRDPREGRRRTRLLGALSAWLCLPEPSPVSPPPPAVAPGLSRERTHCSGVELVPTVLSISSHSVIPAPSLSESCGSGHALAWGQHPSLRWVPVWWEDKSRPQTHWAAHGVGTPAAPTFRIR